MFGRQAYIALAQWLLQTDRNAILIAPGDEPHAGGGADRAVCVGMGKTRAFACEAVDIRGLVFAAAIAGEVGIAHVIGHDEQEVGLAAIARFHGRAAGKDRYRSRPGEPGNCGAPRDGMGTSCAVSLKRFLILDHPVCSSPLSDVLAFRNGKLCKYWHFRQ